MAVLAQWCIAFSFRDAKGQTRHITICFTTDQGTNATDASVLTFSVQGVVNALQACSNAHVQSEINIFPTTPGQQSGVTWGAAAEYQSVAQQARLYYLSSDPSGDPAPTSSITIPAPLASIFEADGVTVNPGNANIVALNTALAVGGLTSGSTAVMCTRSGLVASSFVGGIFLGKKLSRKWTRYTKDPTLTIAGI
jgi:hypothetical protein